MSVGCVARDEVAGDHEHGERAEEDPDDGEGQPPGTLARSTYAEGPEDDSRKSDEAARAEGGKGRYGDDAAEETPQSRTVGRRGCRCIRHGGQYPAHSVVRPASAGDARSGHAGGRLAGSTTALD